MNKARHASRRNVASQTRRCREITALRGFCQLHHIAFDNQIHHGEDR